MSHARWFYVGLLVRRAFELGTHARILVDRPRPPSRDAVLS